MSRLGFRIILWIVPTAFIAVAVPAAGQGPSAAPASGRAAAATIPTMEEFYTLPLDGDAGPRVKFVQNADVLTATWITTQGDIYGRGTYRWDAGSRLFAGTSTTTYTCVKEDGRPPFTFQHVIREQLIVVNDHELRDRWTKPLDVDCSIGLVEKFRWSEWLWIATDDQWKPLRPLLQAHHLPQ